MNPAQTPENAEIIALQGLGWLAGDETGIGLFMDQAGIDAATLRQAAGSPGMCLAVLEFLLSHEDLLLRFCESAGVAPKELHLARHQLGGA